MPEKQLKRNLGTLNYFETSRIFEVFLRYAEQLSNKEAVVLIKNIALHNAFSLKHSDLV